ncbi:MAG: HAMP domain-containing histidine kinase [Deltaproteobacteria bacterium]|nr:HAMP domain-containing histidine kinase [Deltaproteobacteria bacterium]
MRSNDAARARGDARMLLVRLRWFAVLGQCLALAFMGEASSVPILGVVAVVFVTVQTNVWLRLRASRSPSPIHSHSHSHSHAELHSGRHEVDVPAVLLLDVVLLTVLLALTGGPSNPFSILYLIHVVLAAVLARPVWTWSVALLSSAAFGSLFFLSMPSSMFLMNHGHGSSYDFHLQGMWVAFTLAAAVVAAFSARLAAELRVARDEQAKAERLAGLATLAAGAAHEIGNRLATIRIAVGELNAALEELGVDEGHLADLRLIDAEVSRAHSVLGRMALSAGERSIELPASIDLSKILSRACEQLGHDARRVIVTVESNDQPSAVLVEWPEQAATQAIVQILRNALSASAQVPSDGDGDVGGGPREDGYRHDPGLTPGLVMCRARRIGDRVDIEIEDHGVGMSPEVLERVGQPFFTTRPGVGMGLGVFLARSMAEHLGGTLTFRSTLGVGTSVCFSVPVEVVV